MKDSLDIVTFVELLKNGRKPQIELLRYITPIHYAVWAYISLIWNWGGEEKKSIFLNYDKWQHIRFNFEKKVIKVKKSQAQQMEEKSENNSPTIFRHWEIDQTCYYTL